MTDDPYWAVLDDRFQWCTKARQGWQFGESGIIAEFVRRAGLDIDHFVYEIGGGDGGELPLTCQLLSDPYWKVIVFEAVQENREALAKKHPWLFDIRGKYESSLQIENLRPGIVIIDVDSCDGWYMEELLETSKPSLLVVEHYDLAGPYIAEFQDFDGRIPKWLCGMPLFNNFRIQWHADALDVVAVRAGYLPFARTRCNSFYIDRTLINKVCARVRF